MMINEPCGFIDKHLEFVLIPTIVIEFHKNITFFISNEYIPFVTWFDSHVFPFLCFVHYLALHDFTGHIVFHDFISSCDLQ